MKRRQEEVFFDVRTNMCEIGYQDKPNEIIGLTQLSSEVRTQMQSIVAKEVLLVQFDQESGISMDTKSVLGKLILTPFILSQIQPSW